MTLMMDRGLVVSRPTADVVTGGTVAIFTVSRGRVLLLGLVGEITTIIGAGATNFRFQSNPTTGTTVNLSADLDIDADEAGSLMSISGVAATATQRGESGSVPTMLTKGVVVAPGAIEVVTSADRTGSIKFLARYIPLDEGAAIVAT